MRVGDVRQLDRQLRALPAEVEAGRIAATSPDRNQLRGALAALSLTRLHTAQSPPRVRPGVRPGS